MRTREEIIAGLRNTSDPNDYVIVEILLDIREAISKPVEEERCPHGIESEKCSLCYLSKKDLPELPEELSVSTPWGNRGVDEDRKTINAIIRYIRARE